MKMRKRRKRRSLMWRMRVVSKISLVQYELMRGGVAEDEVDEDERPKKRKAPNGKAKVGLITSSPAPRTLAPRDDSGWVPRCSSSLTLAR